MPTNDGWYSYPLILASVAAPMWAPILENLNLILTTFTLIGGLILLALKLENEFNSKHKKDDNDP